MNSVNKDVLILKNTLGGWAEIVKALIIAAVEEIFPRSEIFGYADGGRYLNRKHEIRNSK
jgi:hypothetical protein